MWRKILNLLRLLMWWIILFATIAVIGFVLWPILQNKANTMAIQGWDEPAYADTLQQGFEGKLKSFFTISHDATTDILTDESGKIAVEYKPDAEGVYRPVDVQN